MQEEMRLMVKGILREELIQESFMGIEFVRHRINTCHDDILQIQF